MMHCRNCKKVFDDGETMIPVDAGFVCGLVCKREHELTSTLNYIEKDITTVEKGIIAHGVNCQHAMGSGVAGAIKAKWPQVYQQFMNDPSGKKMLGEMSAIEINPGLYVVNCYTQHMYGYGGGRYADLDAVRRSLSQVYILSDYVQLPVYMPKIGCGLGGLDWDKEVEPVISSLNTFFGSTKTYVCEYGE